MCKEIGYFDKKNFIKFFLLKKILFCNGKSEVGIFIVLY